MTHDDFPTHHPPPGSGSPPDDTLRQGLLHAVLRNPELRRKLDRMPADEKTIALTSQSGTDFSHPNWKAGEVESAQFETLELNLETQLPDAESDGQPPQDEGFVPLRRVAHLSDPMCDDSDYRVVGKLGGGGTGIVYQAHQRAIDREVALKVLRPELAVNTISRERFLVEARVIGGLDHPNVIALHEVCVDESGGLFYSMKRIDGASWDRQIADMSLDENLNTLLRVADAIRYAHSRGLIHRDIKPENVMLGRFGEVLLADWGLALSYNDGETRIGVNQSIGGTPAYMAPELASGLESAICFQSDVYLLGAILFQILTGSAPHVGKSLLACIHAAAHNEIRETEVEGELMDIARKAMSTLSRDRYQSVDAFIEAVRNQRQHDESSRLARRACERISLSDGANQYEDFRVADALLIESLDVWPENQRAEALRKKLQLQFASTATERGDLDLAISIYETAGEGDSEAAEKVRRVRKHRELDQRRGSRYSALFMHSPEAGLLIQMSTGNVVEANEVFGRLFGYSNDQVVGQAVADLNLWVHDQERNKLVKELEESGRIENFAAVFLHTDGHMIDVLISGRVVEVDGEPMVISTIRDISMLRRAEKEVRRSRQRLRDLQRLAGLATWSYDVRTGEVTWSEEAFLLAGRPREQGVPSKDEYFEMIHPDDREKLRDTFDTAIQSGAAYELFIRQRDSSDNYKNVLVRGQPIFDDDGNTIEIYGVLIPQRR